MRTTIYIHENLWKQAKVMAAEDGRTFSGLVTRLIVEKIGASLNGDSLDEASLVGASLCRDSLCRASKEKECKKQPRKEVKP